MRRFLRDNSLSLVMFGLFAFSFAGQILTGYQTYNDERRDHGRAAVGRIAYFSSGHFIESLFENWESEFLQMSAYVFLTAYLYQKGAADSRKPGIVERTDLIPDDAKNLKDAPYPVRRGGWLLEIYKRSLTIALFTLFLISFALHACGGARAYNEDQLAHGRQTVTALQYLGTSRFWFESFQNWQSEFFSIGMMIVLSIWLRQKGSPESKPVDAPHNETGE